MKILMQLFFQICMRNRILKQFIIMLKIDNYCLAWQDGIGFYQLNNAKKNRFGVFYF